MTNTRLPSALSRTRTISYNHCSKLGKRIDLIFAAASRAQRPTTRLYLAALCIALTIGVSYYSLNAFGVLFWLVFASGVLGLCLSVGFAFQGLRETLLPGWSNLTLVVASIGLALILVECCLALSSWIDATNSRKNLSATDGPLLHEGSLSDTAQQKMVDRLGVWTLPTSWERRDVPGASRDYMWHGAVHRHDDNLFRRDQPFPTKQTDIFRIMVVGDSLTYGYGIAEEHTYSAILQQVLAQDYAVEVFNLGISGNQSVDTLATLQKFVPLLKPDLVVYGVCLNDFLPSKVGEYKLDEHAFPLPKVVKRYFSQRSRLGGFIAHRYNQLLLQQGLRVDFMDDILSDFDAYQSRFREDVQAMSEWVQASHGIPLTAMVLHQSPRVPSRAHNVALAAEKHLLAAGINVVHSRPYFDAYEGRTMTVSQWESHPNELANALFASMLIADITNMAEIAPYEINRSYPLVKQ